MVINKKILNNLRLLSWSFSLDIFFLNSQQFFHSLLYLGTDLSMEAGTRDQPPPIFYLPLSYRTKPESRNPTNGGYRIFFHKITSMQDEAINASLDDYQISFLYTTRQVQAFFYHSSFTQDDHVQVRELGSVVQSREEKFLLKIKTCHRYVSRIDPL